MNGTAADAWERFLNPDTLKSNIICASTYIVAFDILKNSIIERIKGFYSVDFDKVTFRPIETDRYRKEVLSLNKSPLYASLQWHKENEVIDHADLDRFEVIKELRNKFAHEMMQFLAGDNSDYSLQPFKDMVHLLKKIEVWWIVNFEMATSPELYPEDLDIEEIMPGPVLSLQLLIQTALGSSVDAHNFYESVIRQINTGKFD